MLQPGEIWFAFLLIVLSAWIGLQHQNSQPLPQPPSKPRQLSTEPPTQPPSPILNTISTPYNEAEIVSLITELYSLLIKLAYFNADEVSFPPKSGHQINEDLCHNLHLDAAVISLMKKLPYIGYGVHLFPRSMVYCFLQDRDILESRDPENILEKERRLDYILPHDIALSHNLRDGMGLVLDTKANTVRMIETDSPEFVNPEGTVLERPDDPFHYRNFYTQHAPSYFRRLNEKICTLKLIPSGPCGFDQEYHGDEDPQVRDGIKKTLTERYGWPDDFQQEDWLRDAEETWNDLFLKIN